LSHFAFEKQHETEPERTSSRIARPGSALVLLVGTVQKLRALIFFTDEPCSIRKLLQILRLERRLAIGFC
jgi:hypothetical protein